MAGDSGQNSVLHQRLACILAADVVGYTRLMERDERDTHSRLMELRFSIMQPLVGERHGRIVKNTGDGFMAMFECPRAAMESAIAMQRAVTEREADLPPDRRIAFRMGLNIADVIVEDHDIYGDGVNIAARLQGYAEPGGIVISGAVRDEVGGTLGLDAVDLGLLQLRNLSNPVQVISLRLPGAPTASVGEMAGGYEGRAWIAVLPFRNLASSDEAYFAHGIVDHIIYALAALKELFVISRGSTVGFQDQTIDARAIGERLGVRYVLHGSALRLGNRLRISTELSDATTGEIIRADQYHGELGDLFDLQDRIAQEVVKTIAPNVRERELKKSLRKHPQNMTAYDLVLQAAELLYQLDYVTFSRSRGLLQRAMALDPGYAPAFSYAAYWHLFRIGQEWSTNPASDASEAGRLASSAIDIDGNDATALAIYGYVHAYQNKDYEAAIEFFDRAIGTSPNCPLAWTFKGATFCFLGDGPGAVRCAETGVRLLLDHCGFFAEHIVAQAHYVNGNFEKAIAWARRADKHNPRHTSNLRTLISSLVVTHRVDEAREIAVRHAKIVPGFTVSAWAARTPMQGDIRRHRIERLLAAGMPE